MLRLPLRPGDRPRTGPACDPGHDKHPTLADIVALRAEGKSLMVIRDETRACGHWISHQLVANTLASQAEGAARAISIDIGGVTLPSVLPSAG